MNYGYIRVSNDKQSVLNQQHAITQFCLKQRISIDGWIQETISGISNYDKRGLGKLLRKVGKDDLILCAELSRLGRNLYMIMDILYICLNKGCHVWTVKEGYRLGEDIQSKVLAFAFGLAAEIERDLISARTREALARKRSEGVRLGRPRGSACFRLLDGQEVTIRQLLQASVPKKAIARKCGVSLKTLYSWLHWKKEEKA